MTDIALGQSIAGSLTAADPQIDGRFYDEYNLNSDSFRQLLININPSAEISPSIELINSATGTRITLNLLGNLTLAATTFPGINYKVRVSSPNLGDYTISAVDGGKATSIVTNSNNYSPVGTGFTPFGIGTVGADGVYFPLARGSAKQLSDVALARNGQFYGLQTDGFFNSLVRIDPSLEGTQQVTLPPINNPSRDIIVDTNGQKLTSTLNALEFDADNQLYSTGVETTGAKFYQIDVNTKVATVLASLPTGLGSAGDLVYDATNKRFLAVSKDTATTDALWQIPLNNPSGATKVGQIGFTDVQGIDFENGQLTGFTTSDNSPTTGNRIEINASSGVGVLDRAISTTEVNRYYNSPRLRSQELVGSGISGASTIVPATTTPSPDPTRPPIEIPIAYIDLKTNLFSSSNTTSAGLRINAVSQKAGSKVSEIGAFAVDDATGKIGGIAPGTAGYLKLATDSAKTIFSALNGSFFSTNARDVGLDANKTYEFFQVQDGSIADVQQQIASGKTPTNILFSLPGGNGASPFKITANGTTDYKISINNDEIVFNAGLLLGGIVPPNIPIGAKSQGLAQGRILDLTGSTGTFKADVTTKSDAAYNDTIAFYVVEDAILGTIKTTTGNILKPGDANYAAEAIKSAVLSAGKTDSQLNQALAGGKIYAPVVISQGTLADFATKNPTNVGDGSVVHAYFNYLGANPDKLDHFRLLGNNTFGVEDLYGGGDRDFNDVVVNVNIKVV